MADEMRQPKIRPDRSLSIVSGSRRAVAKLDALGFDPISELVKKYLDIDDEIEYQKKLRSGEIVELTYTGKPRAYRAEIHHALYDKLIKVSESLLRYKYGRVPETEIVENRSATPMIVNLTKKGEQYVLNDSSGESDDQERV